MDHQEKRAADKAATQKEAAERLSKASPRRTPPLTRVASATLKQRALGFGVDALLLLILTTPLMWLAYGEPVAKLIDPRPLSLAINWLLPGLISIAFWTWQGATPGKLVAGIRVIDMQTGRNPSLKQSALRWLGYFASAVPLGFGIFSAIADPERRTWHDKLSGTRVVPSRESNDTGAGYIGAHWRGEQSLVQSYWVNNGLLLVPLTMALTGLMSWISMKGEALQAGSIATLIGWPLMIAIDIWCIVGAWRSATAYGNMGGSALWSGLAKFSLAGSALQVLASLFIGFLPQIDEYWSMARGIDPIGQAELSLSADGRVAHLNGPIGMGDATRLKALLEQSPQKVRLIELASPGGRVYEAERMVEAIRAVGSDTRAIGDCASACTLVFLAGGKRQLMPGAQLGFHRASSGTYNPVFDEIANQELSATYRRMGLPEYFVERTAKTPSHSMWWPRSEELVSHQLIVAPPLTLDIALPEAGSAVNEYKEALRANPAWYRAETRFPGLLDGVAARMHELRGLVPADTDPAIAQAAVQIAGLEAFAPQIQELILASPPELRHRYVGLLREQLKVARAAGPEQCQALLGGQLPPRRELPAALLAQETDWIGDAAEAAPPRRQRVVATAIELEVVRRTLGAHAPGMLSGLWSGGKIAPAARCDAVLQTLARTAALPVAQRELAERVMFQPH